MPTKLKAAFLCPCIGHGGADALMCGLIAQTRRAIDWQGIAVLRPGETNGEQMDWVREAGVGVPIHLWHDRDWYPPPGVIPHPTRLATAQAVANGADVVISWCVDGGGDVYPYIAPTTVVEYAQNEDQYAAAIATANAPRAHAFVACSKAAAQAFGEHAAKATILYNAADPRRVSPARGRDATREALAVAPGDKLLLIAGRLAAEKNPQAMIQALTRLPSEWRGLCVGRGPIRESLEIMAKALLPGRVQFADYVHHVGDFYAAADVFLLASDFEGDSLALHEAALAGVPIVTTEVGSVPEFTERFGELYSTLPFATEVIRGQVRRRRNTPEEIAAAVLRADSAEFRDGPASLARGVQWEHFTLPTIAAQWEELLHLVVDAERRGARATRSKRMVFAEPLKRA
jgi:glycosyltransferase involved in cell wall biosynthesis